MDPIAGRSVALAKTSRPQGNRPVARPRLFARLDALRHVPMIWVAGSPGAGKTTLVSSWLAEHAMAPGTFAVPSPLWYQLDADDGDVATFFYYLGQAVRQATARDDLAWPSLTPEYLPGLLSFTRRCAGTIAAALEAPLLLVLDNYEQVPAASPLHEVVRELSSTLPRGSNLVVLSRAEPPPAFARLRLHEGLVLLEARELDLTRDEALALATSRQTSHETSRQTSSEAPPASPATPPTASSAAPWWTASASTACCSKPRAGWPASACCWPKVPTTA